jgi:hypothetical protein
MLLTKPTIVGSGYVRSRSEVILCISFIPQLRLNKPVFVADIVLIVSRDNGYVVVHCLQVSVTWAF